MFLILYHLDTYRELTLESADNMDHWLFLDAQDYHLHHSVQLHLDITAHTWTLHARPEYQILLPGGESVQQVCLRDGCALTLVTAGGDRVALVAVEHGSALPVGRKFACSSISRLRFGSGEDNEVRYTFQELVSKHHGELVWRDNALWLIDHSTNGTYCNGRRLSAPRRLVFGDKIQLFGLMILYLGSVLCIVSRGGELAIREDALPELHDVSSRITNKPPASASREQYINRSPRTLPELHSEKFTIEAVPDPQKTKSRPLLLTIGPSLTMALPMLLGSLLAMYGMRSSGMRASAFMYTGLITAVGSAVLGVVWAMANLRQQERELYEAERTRVNAYSNYLMQQAETLRGQYTSNTQAMHSTYPAPAVLCGYDQRSPLLWNRDPHHADFLFQRLGTGDIPFQVDIEIPRSRFTLQKDLLQEKPAELKQQFSELHHVPVGIDLAKELLVGVVGGVGKKGAVPVVYSLLAGLAATCCYTDVKIGMVCSADSQTLAQWSFVKWLPHIWNEARSSRYFAAGKTEASDVFYELCNVLRARVDSGGKGTVQHKPHYVLFVEDISLLEGELITKYLYARDPSLGITTVLLASRCEDLPNACECIVENTSRFSGILYPMKDVRRPVAFDLPQPEEMRRQAHTLSGLKVHELENGSDIPDQLDFLSMYGVRTLDQLHIADRWRKNRTYTSMRVPIGVKAGGALCCLDIHEKFHGPHGLIAGTTGSGKSETLQTYILSLALNFSPEDVGFFVIDFKGGGMANLFSGLPHMMGQISNLSGNQVRRAMISIKSENRRRQRLFNEYDVNNINQYTRLYKSGESRQPIPHLFIIIDEFAELKREEPEFMRELISVAQVGRSLGVHLLLATQKPSGTVDDNIWSNAKFRLCLRVQDRQDSNDMLHKPDAAFITQAGRGYLQVGNDEIYEQFQSGWSGAVYDEKNADTSRATAILLTRTGKTGIVGSRTKIKQRAKERLLWLTALAQETLEAACGTPPALHADELTEQLCAGRTFADGRLTGSASARRALHNFLRLWPDGCTDASSAAAAILAQAEADCLPLPAPQDKTQLDALVEYIAQTARRLHLRGGPPLWLPVLPRVLALPSLADPSRCFAAGRWPEAPVEWCLSAPAGLLDDPENQLQTPLTVDLAAGRHLAVCGSVFSGKSTLLQTITYGLLLRYPPDWVNFYILDFSSRMMHCLADAPHVGGVMDESDLDRVGNFFCMLERILDERKGQFKGGNYSQFVRVNGVVIPSIVIVIDNYAAFAEKTGGKYDAILLRAAREGVGYGIFLMLSAAEFGLGGIPTRIAENLKTVLCLGLSDKFKYMEMLHTGSIPVLPESGVPGRGLALADKTPLEFQAAVAADAPDDYARGRILSGVCAEMQRAWTGAKARPVPRIPEFPTASLLRAEADYPALCADPRWLPIGYHRHSAALYAVDLSQTYCYTVLGRERTGRANTLKLLMQAAADKHARLVVFEKDTSRLQAIAERLGAQYLTSDAELFRFWKETTPEFMRRNKRKKEIENSGATEAEIYQAMKDEPLLCFFIADLPSYFKSIYQPQTGVGKMDGFMENILQKGALHNIFFFGCMQPDDQNTAVQTAFRHYLSHPNGILLGGNASSQRLFNFQNIPFAQLSKPLPKGIGLATAPGDDTQAQTVVLPLADR